MVGPEALLLDGASGQARHDVALQPHNKRDDGQHLDGSGGEYHAPLHAFATGSLNAGIHYATTKAGILGFVRTLARLMGEHGITVNAVAPGIIDTELSRHDISPEVRVRLMKEIPARDFGQPTDVAHAVAFLVSEGARYVTGATLDINGGLWIG